MFKPSVLAPTSAMLASRLLVSLALTSVPVSSVVAQEQKRDERQRETAVQIQKLKAKLIKQRKEAQLAKLLKDRQLQVQLEKMKRAGVVFGRRRLVRPIATPKPVDPVLSRAKASVAKAHRDLARARSLKAIKKAADALELATIELRRVVWKLKREKAASATKKK